MPSTKVFGFIGSNCVSFWLMVYNLSLLLIHKVVKQALVPLRALVPPDFNINTARLKFLYSLSLAPENEAFFKQRLTLYPNWRTSPT